MTSLRCVPGLCYTRGPGRMRKIMYSCGLLESCAVHRDAIVIWAVQPTHQLQQYGKAFAALSITVQGSHPKALPRQPQRRIAQAWEALKELLEEESRVVPGCFVSCGSHTHRLATRIALHCIVLH